LGSERVVISDKLYCAGSIVRDTQKEKR